MKTFMESQFLYFIPKFVNKVVDSKSFIKRYVEEVAGLKEMHVFRFFIDMVVGMSSSTKTGIVNGSAIHAPLLSCGSNVVVFFYSDITGVNTTDIFLIQIGKPKNKHT